MLMKYLCDTNILIEVFLARAHALSCSDFLNRKAHEIALTNYAVFSFCIIAERQRKEKEGFTFINTILQSRITVISVSPSQAVESLFAKMFTRFDYDDFTQYRSAKENKLILVSLDKDFFQHKLDIPILRPDQVK